MISSSFSSCASILRTHKLNVEVPISGEPVNATVYVNDIAVGVTPMTYTVTKRRKHHVKIEKEEYYSQNYKIARKLSPLWTAISVVTGSFPGLGIPVIIDFATNSLYNIKGQEIKYILDKETEQSPENTRATSNEDSRKSTKGSSSNKSSSSTSLNPKQPKAIHIETVTRDLKLFERTFVYVTTSNGVKMGSAITSIGKDHMVMRKNNQKIYYKNITKMRIMPTRSWYPIVMITTGIGWLYWWIPCKIVRTEAKKCKQQIEVLEVVNGLRESEFGKPKCN